MSTKKTLIIIGAGGHGKVVADSAEEMACYDEIFYLDGRAPELKVCGVWQVIDQPQNFIKYNQENVDFFVAIGENLTRKKWLTTLMDSNINVATIIHPKAVISKHASVDQGSLICANATINPFTQIGIGCIVNTAASIDHDCVIEEFVHIAPGNNIAGTVKVDKLSFVGIGCSIIQGITIGKNSVIGAGSAVVTNISDNTLAVGCPAKAIKLRKKIE